MAQDPQFSQFYANPLYLSPSLTGATDGSRASVNFRDQWPEIPGAFVTYSASFDQFLSRYKSGIGLMFLKDQAGSGKLGTTTVGLLYSYNIPITRTWMVRPGINFMYNTRSIDFSKLVFNDQLAYNTSTSTEIPTLEKIKYFDFSASAIVYSFRHWVGFTYDHLFMPNQSLLGVSNISNLPRKFSLYGGSKILINGDLNKNSEESVSVTFLYKSQAKYDQLDLGLYWYKYSMMFGVWYRGIPMLKQYKKGYQNNDAAILMVGYKTETFSVGYSYDFTISRLISSTGGAHEISLVYVFNQNMKLQKRKKKVVVPCPRI